MGDEPIGAPGKRDLETPLLARLDAPEGLAGNRGIVRRAEDIDRGRNRCWGALLAYSSRPGALGSEDHRASYFAGKGASPDAVSARHNECRDRHDGKWNPGDSHALLLLGRRQ